MNTRKQIVVGLGVLLGLSQAPFASAQAVDPVTAIAYRLAPMALPLAAGVISAAVPMVTSTTLFGARAFALTVRAGSMLPAYAKERIGEIPRPQLFHREPAAPAPKVAYVPKNKANDDNPSRENAVDVSDPSWSSNLSEVTADTETKVAKSSVSAVVSADEQGLTETTSVGGTVDASSIQAMTADPALSSQQEPAAEAAVAVEDKVAQPAQLERIQVKLPKKANAEPAYSSADTPVVMHKAKSDGHGGWLRAD